MRAMETKRQKYVVLAAGLALMLCEGILYMWSVFQPYVVEHHGWAAGDVAMTSALMIACFVAGNILGGLVQEKLPTRLIALTGSLMFCLGMFLTSLIGSGTPAMIYLTYSVISGLGCGLAYCTVLYALQKWFAAQNGLITGLTVAFFGLSVVVLSPVAEGLLSSFGVPFTFRALSLVFLAITGVSSLLMCKPSSEYYMREASKVLRKDEFKQFTPREMLRTPMYYQIVISMLMASAAYLVLVPFIKTIATDRGMSDSVALAAVMVTGVANAAGRILAPAVSDKLGRTNVLILCYVISAAACLMMIFATGPLYIAAVFLIAFTYGGTSGVNPVMATELFGAKHSGTNYGLVMISIAASSILFGKLSAVVGGSSSGSMTPVFVLCAVICVIPIVLMRMMHNFCLRKGGKRI